jgi:hypothetical protein
VFGLRRLVIVSGLLLVSGLQIAAVRADTPSAEANDPPDAVGRISVLSGAVQFRTNPSAPEQSALLNYPLSFGNVVETAPRAHATIDIAAGRFYLDGRTRLRIGALADGSSAVALDRGALVLHVLPGGDGQVFSIETAKGTLRIDQPGYYEVEAEEGDQPMTASAMEGGAQFRMSDAVEHVLHPNERIAVGGGKLTRGAAIEDDLIRRVAAEIEEIGENKAPAPEHVSPQMTGFQDLVRYGIWVLASGYGPVWEPQVSSDWAPYSRGQWVEIAPWGKTWIDAAPWGFAPFHYGRWTTINRRWAWVPGDIEAAPVYAPALVSFFDTPKDEGAARRWIPLGPEEPYLPPYRVSVVYFRQINRPALPTVVNITKITNIVQITNVVKIVDRRPVFILSRLVNRPGAPPPRPRPNSGHGVSAMVVTQPGPLPLQVQNAPALRPIVTPGAVRQGQTVIVNQPPPTVTAPQTAPVIVQTQPQVQQPIAVIGNRPPAIPDVPAGGGASTPPVVVTRTVPIANGVKLGTSRARPTATFGQSAGPNGVTFP